MIRPDAAMDGPQNQIESKTAIVKRPKPVTSCTDCGAPGYNIQLANGKCGRRVGDKRCKGTNQSAIGENDWAECKACMGEGCAECTGVGWLFLPRHKYRLF